jgi:mRNA interferase RelE/StbE
MAWTIEFDPEALRDLERLDSQVRRRILSFLTTRVATLSDPRQIGSVLHGKKYENQWRYRVGDYRIVAEIKFDIVKILVIEIGHRREIYR